MEKKENKAKKVNKEKTKSKKKNESFLDKIKCDFKKVVLGNMIITLLFLIFGIVIYLKPYATLNTLGIFTGIYFIVFGLIYIYEYLLRYDNPIFNFKIYIGIIAVLLGIFTIFNPFHFFKILTLTLGIYLAIIGINRIIQSLRMKKYDFDGWIVMLVGAILEVLMGLLLVFNPFVSLTIVEVTGIFIVLGCILELAHLFMCYNKAKEIEKVFKNM